MTRPQSNVKKGKRIGNGHFGEVFEGQDPVHGRVAIKIPKKHVNESETEFNTRKKALLVEGQLLAAATHPNIVQVFYLVEADPDVWLVLQHCAGGSLLSSFESGPLGLSRVRTVATEIGLGLQTLHNRKMIHRDIKPANILLGADGRARLGDFGLVTDNLILGYASGTGYLDHLAYEVMHGKGTSVRSDIWAWGMTLYRLLHGKAWYDRHYAAPKPRFAVNDGNFAKKLKWLPSIPADWRRLIRKMMHDDPRCRFQTATSVLNALAKLTIAPDWRLAFHGEQVEFCRTTSTHEIRVFWEQAGKNKPWAASGSRLSDGLTRSRGSGTGEDSLARFLQDGG